MKKTTSGFTIVELLIVIVVIAILAAISIVAYTGIQNRAYDSSISSDLTNIAKQLEITRIDSATDAYPYGNPGFNAAIKVQVNKNAYIVTPSAAFNLLVCRPPGSHLDIRDFVVLATSKSGNQFSIRNGGSVQKNTGDAWSVNASDSVCNSLNSGWIASAAGYAIADTTTGPWRAWAGGN